jgi:hypothetical protein
MTPKKTRKSTHQRQPSNLHPVSDYDTDAAGFTDQGLPQTDPPPASRTNEELNLAVLQRHKPDVVSILSTAQYTVVYRYSAASSSWEKCGVEGSLFVVQLQHQYWDDEHLALPEEEHIFALRYGVVILNRRGLENFEAELSNGDDVEVTDEFVILQIKHDQHATSGHQDSASEPDIIGLWIFSEPPPSSTAQSRVINATMIRDCALQAEASRNAAQAAFDEAERATGLNNGHGHHQPQEDANGAVQPRDAPIEGESSIPMGRQLSLRQLFGQQRQDDDAWTTRGQRGAHTHRPRPPPTIHHSPLPFSQAGPPEEMIVHRGRRSPQHGFMDATSDRDFHVIPEPGRKVRYGPAPHPPTHPPVTAEHEAHDRAGAPYQVISVDPAVFPRRQHLPDMSAPPMMQSPEQQGFINQQMPPPPLQQQQQQQQFQSPPQYRHPQMGFQPPTGPQQQNISPAYGLMTQGRGMPPQVGTAQPGNQQNILLGLFQQGRDGGR